MAVRADARLTVFGLWLLCHLILGHLMVMFKWHLRITNGDFTNKNGGIMGIWWIYDIYRYMIIWYYMILYYIYIHNYIRIYIEMHIVVIYNYCLAMVHWNITNETLDKTGAFFWFRQFRPLSLGLQIGMVNYWVLTNEYHQWIGLRENLQETMVFTIKYRGFL